MALCKNGYSRCPSGATTGSCLSMNTLSNCGECGNKCGRNSACVGGKCECKPGYIQDPFSANCVRPGDLLKTCYSKGNDECKWPCALRNVGSRTQKCLSPYDPFAEIMTAQYDHIDDSIIVKCVAQFTKGTECTYGNWQRCIDQVTILVDGVEKATEIGDEYGGIQNFIVRGFRPEPDGRYRVQVQITPLVGQKFLSDPVPLRF